jgi:clan AA aspartic protease (TIGR02281 family)
MCSALAHARDVRDSDVVIIELKNRGKIEGVIVSETEKGMVVDVGFGTVAVSREDIMEIRSPAGFEKDDKVRKWKRHRAEVQRGVKRRKIEEEAVKRRIEEGMKVKEDIARRARREEGHRIKFSNRSRITTEVVLNGEVTTTLLVDTGATAVVIPIDVAEQLTGVELDPSRRIEAKLADGTVRKGFPVMLSSVEVGDMKAGNVEAIAMDLKGKHGLLGMSYLNRFHLNLDIENNELVIKEK